MAPFLSSLNMILQIAILILLLMGYLEARRKRNFLKHGYYLTFAMIINTLSFLLIMGPSLIEYRIWAQPLNLLNIIVIIHAVVGLVVIVQGIWIFWGWRLQSNVKGCIYKRKQMKTTLYLWILAFITGSILYGSFFY